MKGDVQTRFQKSRGTRDQIANIRWIMEKPREFHKKSTSASLAKLKPLTVWITANCGKFLRDWNIRPHLSPGKPVYGSRINSTSRHGTTDWFKIGKGV